MRILSRMMLTDVITVEKVWVKILKHIRRNTKLLT
jgi:hypothetical protein